VADDCSNLNGFNQACTQGGAQYDGYDQCPQSAGFCCGCCLTDAPGSVAPANLGWTGGGKGKLCATSTSI
jgi:hypothetical protein